MLLGFELCFFFLVSASRLYLHIPSLSIYHDDGVFSFLFCLLDLDVRVAGMDGWHHVA